eukprot:scaffold111_cov404-Prasinococcus_capsulatus_cf.AAC.19
MYDQTTQRCTPCTAGRGLPTPRSRCRTPDCCRGPDRWSLKDRSTAASGRRLSLLNVLLSFTGDEEGATTTTTATAAAASSSVVRWRIPRCSVQQYGTAGGAAAPAVPQPWDSGLP